MAIDDDKEPLPVPASTIISPGNILSLNIIAEISIENKICVFLAKVSVIKNGLGLSIYK